MLNQKLASEISLRAYYEMSKMQHEVVDYVHGQIKDYYQCVNENNLKLRADIEQCQLLYNQMIRDFFSKANEFRTALSNMENNYSNMVDYNINTDKLSNRMNEIINNLWMILTIPYQLKIKNWLPVMSIISKISLFKIY